MRTATIVTALVIALSAGAAMGANYPLTSLSQSDAASGIKEAMAQGIRQSIAQLGRPDGFLRDELVKIVIPNNLRTVADVTRKLGAGKYVDDLELSMNRAAEKAVPAAADIFADAVRQMTIVDAANIVRGPEDGATQYFRRVTQDRLRDKFRPIVASATSETGVAKNLKALTAKGGGLGQLFGASTPVDLDGYVTDKAMDGLFYYVAQKEKEIRKNPLKQGSDLLRRVFGR